VRDEGLGGVWVRLWVAVTCVCLATCRGRPPEASPAAVVAPAAPAPNRAAINPRLLRRFRPIAQAQIAAPPSNPQMIALGRMLWYEPRLSRSREISCNTCHALSDYGVDHRSTPQGDKGQRLRRNAPTVYNAAQHLAQFWDGRARDLEEQVKGPLLDSHEMGATPASVESFLRATPEYRDRFRDAFPDQPQPVTVNNTARAIAAFERGLVTSSRWDEYLASNVHALSAQETEGLRVFLDVGCMTCHTGPQVGASMFQVTGFVEPWSNQRDLGRFEITGAPADRMVFKVPTLKNVTRTGPYFHDGSCADLPSAVRAMGRHQLGIELGEGEIASIVSFLGALSGDLPLAYIAPPRLPGMSHVTGLAVRSQ
jgi:cytochrome c peroxidase